jgi:hypothetical protein
MSSKTDKESGYNLDVDLLTILYSSSRLYHILGEMRYLEKSKYLTPKCLGLFPKSQSTAFK